MNHWLPSLGIERERGSAAIEAAMLVPLFLVLLSLVIMAGRIRSADGTVVEAARDGARAASLADSTAGARAAGVAAADDTLRSQGMSCTVPQPDTSKMFPALGAIGTVSVTVTCHISMAGLLVAGIGGPSVTVTEKFVAVVDSYR
ncbi:TadE family protein [Streptacidiphilus albus]|uniref:TadE family protein n=1 Tax=Streptacidiphilus albus TaxID=105425 RepID=UPI00068D98B9|nr:TadE family protein [Streptacidiphilus albus]